MPSGIDTVQDRLNIAPSYYKDPVNSIRSIMIAEKEHLAEIPGKIGEEFINNFYDNITTDLAILKQEGLSVVEQALVITHMYIGLLTIINKAGLHTHIQELVDAAINEYRKKPSIQMEELFYTVSSILKS